VAGLGKVWRILKNCTQQQFGASLLGLESVFVDNGTVWPSACSTPDLIIVGGQDDVDDGVKRAQPRCRRDGPAGLGPRPSVKTIVQHDRRGHHHNGAHGPGRTR
jgi:hypothetical protein